MGNSPYQSICNTKTTAALLLLHFDLIKQLMFHGCEDDKSDMDEEEEENEGDDEFDFDTKEMDHEVTFSSFK